MDQYMHKKVFVHLRKVDARVKTEDCLLEKEK